MQPIQKLTLWLGAKSKSKMSNEVELKESVYFLEREKREAMIAFQMRLNQHPPQGQILQHPQNKKEYLPISYIQNTLDEIFPGTWWDENFKSQVIGNEIVGSIELVVKHPITWQEIRHTGAAAALIRQTSGAQITDINAKIKNALEGDYPHLASDCLKNAAKKLGKVFGRDLNRKYEDNYSPGAALSFNDLDDWQGRINERTKSLKVYTKYIEMVRSYTNLRQFDNVKQLVLDAEREKIDPTDLESLKAEINDIFADMLVKSKTLPRG